MSSSSDENSSHEVVEMTSPKNKNHQDGSISKKNKETNPRTPMTLKQLNKAAKKRKIAKSDAIKKGQKVVMTQFRPQARRQLKFNSISRIMWHM